MSDQPTSPASDDPRATGTRRGLLAAGAAGLFGLAGLATARPAAAAAGQSFVLGRSNSAGTALTTHTSSNSLYGFLARGTAGSGALFETTATGKWGARARNVSTTSSSRGGAFLAEGNEANGVYATTKAANRFGVVGQNTDTVAGAGGAVRAEGRRNVGVFADTDLEVADTPAVVALGGDGEFAGVALVAGGTSYLDGEAKALRSYVGVLSASDEVEYAPVVSGEADYHTLTAEAVLDGSGAATVTLPAAFCRTVTMSTLRVSLTPVGGAMPDLHATVTGTDEATGFGIAGGTASGTVHWTVSAVRLALSLQEAAALAPARTAAGATTSGPREDAATAVARVSRGPVRPPRR